jgi:hypothetical protein
MISRYACLEQAHKSPFQALIQDPLSLCQQASIVVVLKVTSTEELRIGKLLGRRTLAALGLALGQYVTTERVLSPGRP